MDTQQSNKPHRSNSKRATAKMKLSSQGKNAKAFAVSRPGKLQKQAKRSSDLNEKKLHVPMIDRTPDDDPPPVIVAVVGPKGTGKTTLIRSLIRRLTKTTLTDIKGPITVVSGKRRRLTFIECGNDLNSMIDIAKVADLVLLMIDGNFGFEMETMEFLNIAQHHGMPKILGVTTHLDLFKKPATLRASKKRLKHRFWTEVYQGAKLFYLSGVINGRYPDREILNLTRFISVMKFRPLRWRIEHPYLLVDRIIDLTHPSLIEKNQKVDRKVAVYGYIHGTALKSENQRVHIAGVGDYTISHVEKLPDPCPTPYYEQRLEEIEREQSKDPEQCGQKSVLRRGRRKRLEDKQKIIYGPMSDVQGVLIDKDAVYIDVGSESFKEGAEQGLGERMVTNLQKASETLDARSFSKVQLFSDTPESLANDVHNVEDEAFRQDSGRKELRQARPYMFDESEISDDAEVSSSDAESHDKGDDREDLNFMEDIRSSFQMPMELEESNIESDSDFDLSDDDTLEAKSYWQEVGSKLNSNEAKKTWDINKLLYMDNIDPNDAISRWKKEEEGPVYSSPNEDGDADEKENYREDQDSEENDNFFVKKDISGNFKQSHEVLYGNDTSANKLRDKWLVDNSALGRLKSRFFVSPKQRLKEVDADDSEPEADYGDFEDLENEEGNSPASSEESCGNDAGNDSLSPDTEATDILETNDLGLASGDESSDLSIERQRERNAKRKEKLKQQFEEEEDLTNNDIFDENDTWYEYQKAKMAKQLEINKAELADMSEDVRAHIEGFAAGSYVKLTFNNLPMEVIENFDPKYPLVIGGLLQTEDRFGFLNARIRRHRWHKKVLKTNDPLILSLGWRRFQTLPIYTTSDSRTRNRMLKYTPEHTYCFATFYGPLVAPNTTFCGVQAVSKELTTGSFRIAATGIVEDLNADVEIVKKLKLVGYPYKIFKNTAFIKDMFSSALEVAKFEGATIRTVSGLRGEIKRALSKPEGHFRATFEDKILMSDIVFLKTWYPIKPKKFYNPVTSLLLSDKDNWRGMKLTGTLKAENNISAVSDPDSEYKKIERKERKFNPLKIPRSIQANLPYKSQLHQMRKQKRQGYLQKRAVVVGGEERKARSIVQTVQTIKKDKDQKRSMKKQEKNAERFRKLAKLEEAKRDKEKQRKKEFFSKSKKRKLATASLAASSDASGKKRKN
ncbi:hypothetical protein KL947_005085 [Ogataea haglerorum]|nr:hypothetical protein KL947_005085 [Ogataea haglerorum]